MICLERKEMRWWSEAITLCWRIMVPQKTQLFWRRFVVVAWEGICGNTQNKNKQIGKNNNFSGRKFCCVCVKWRRRPIQIAMLATNNNWASAAAAAITTRYLGNKMTSFHLPQPATGFLFNLHHVIGPRLIPLLQQVWRGWRRNLLMMR